MKIAQAKAADELQDMLSAGVAQASLFGRAEINLDSQAAGHRRLAEPRRSGSRQRRADGSCSRWRKNIRSSRSCSNTAASQNRSRALARTFSNSSSRRPAAFTPTFARSALRPADSRARTRTSSRSRTSRNTAAASSPRKAESSSSPTIRRSSCEFWPIFRTTKISSRRSSPARIFTPRPPSQVFGVKPEDVTDEQRSFAKRLNFGVVYGIGASRFGLMTGLSQTDAENTMRKYFGTYRGLDDYLRDAGQRVVTETQCPDRLGPDAPLRFDENDRQQIASAKRYGMNMPIQGTSADILKRALRLLHDQIRGTSAKLVNIVHDEVIVECDAAEAEATAKMLEKAMCAAGEEYVKKVPVKVDVHIADEWTK